MDKAQILKHIIAKLDEDFSILLQAAKEAHEAATDKENIPDNKYDTLSLEASYVAQGQANRAQEIKMSLEAYKRLVLKEFDEDSPIYLTALVLLESEDAAGHDSQRWVFIGPQAGGLKTEQDGKEITVITPHSPLGKNLIGKEVGETVTMKTGNNQKEFEILELY